MVLLLLLLRNDPPTTHEPGPAPAQAVPLLHTSLQRGHGRDDRVVPTRRRLRTRPAVSRSREMLLLLLLLLLQILLLVLLLELLLNLQLLRLRLRHALALRRLRRQIGAAGNFETGPLDGRSPERRAVPIRPGPRRRQDRESRLGSPDGSVSAMRPRRWRRCG